MGRQESPQLIERKGQVDTDAQGTSRASKCRFIIAYQVVVVACATVHNNISLAEKQL